MSGRFVRTDTQETNAQGLDTYAYVKNNPLALIDPTGHWGWNETFLAIGPVAAVTLTVAFVTFATPFFIPFAAAAIGAAFVGASIAEISFGLANYRTGDTPSSTDILLVGLLGGASGLVSVLVAGMIPVFAPFIGENVANVLGFLMNTGTSICSGYEVTKVQNLEVQQSLQENGQKKYSQGYQDGEGASPTAVKNAKACGDKSFSNYKHADKSSYSNFAQTSSGVWNHYQQTIYNLWLRTTKDVSESSLKMFESINYYHANKLASLYRNRD